MLGGVHAVKKLHGRKRGNAEAAAERQQQSGDGRQELRDGSDSSSVGGESARARRARLRDEVRSAASGSFSSERVSADIQDPPHSSDGVPGSNGSDIFPVGTHVDFDIICRYTLRGEKRRRSGVVEEYDAARGKYTIGSEHSRFVVPAAQVKRLRVEAGGQRDRVGVG